MVSVSGYLIGTQESGKMPLPPKAKLEWWYQYYFPTERGRAGYDHPFAEPSGGRFRRRVAGKDFSCLRHQHFSEILNA
jgi:hypothetical protein